MYMSKFQEILKFCFSKLDNFGKFWCHYNLLILNTIQNRSRILITFMKQIVFEKVARYYTCLDVKKASFYGNHLRKYGIWLFSVGICKYKPGYKSPDLL